MTLAGRLGGLDAIGARTDGITRLAWSVEDAACREWFERQAHELGLRFERDPAGNLWATPDQTPPWWAVGSHLDSVRGGGRFDGPVGAACGFEVAARSADVAVVSFADEEGARWGTPTFGSKALTGVLDPGVLERADEEGVRLADAMRAAGVDPEGIASAPEWLARLAGFVEVHIDQSTDVARSGAPLAVVRTLAARRRLRAELRGRADHAGTTHRGERRDALASAARLIVAADDLGMTAARIEVEPNASTTIASLVRVWLDARRPREHELDDRLAELAVRVLRRAIDELR